MTFPEPDLNSTLMNVLFRSFQPIERWLLAWNSVTETAFKPEEAGVVATVQIF